MVSDQEMQMYQDLALLEQIEKKNEKTKEVIELNKSKIGVIEDS